MHLVYFVFSSKEQMTWFGAAYLFLLCYPMLHDDVYCTALSHGFVNPSLQSHAVPYSGSLDLARPS